MYIYIYIYRERERDRERYVYILVLLTMCWLVVCVKYMHSNYSVLCIIIDNSIGSIIIRSGSIDISCLTITS